MTKELERAGLPTAQICTITSIASAVGAARIVQGTGIPHPLGDPALNEAAEERLRRETIERALEAMSTELEAARTF